jgi:hypothetical protein
LYLPSSGLSRSYQGDPSHPGTFFSSAQLPRCPSASSPRTHVYHRFGSSPLVSCVEHHTWSNDSYLLASIAFIYATGPCCSPPSGYYHSLGGHSTSYSRAAAGLRLTNRRCYPQYIIALRTPIIIQPVSFCPRPTLCLIRVSVMFCNVLDPWLLLAPWIGFFASSHAIF